MEINLCWWSGEHAAVGRRRAGPGLESSEPCTCLGWARQASSSHGEPQNPNPQGVKIRWTQWRGCKTQRGHVTSHCSHPTQRWCFLGENWDTSIRVQYFMWRSQVEGQCRGAWTAAERAGPLCYALHSWQESILLIQYINILICQYVDAINCQVQNNPWQVMCVCSSEQHFLCAWYMIYKHHPTQIRSLGLKIYDELKFHMKF